MGVHSRARDACFVLVQLTGGGLVGSGSCGWREAPQRNNVNRVVKSMLTHWVTCTPQGNLPGKCHVCPREMRCGTQMVRWLPRDLPAEAGAALEQSTPLDSAPPQPSRVGEHRLRCQ